jgi:F0F1-type ATP synthase membrane subunit c/vacuolar-type H+-ATPase subunit K
MFLAVFHPSKLALFTIGVAIGAGSALASPASPIPRNPTISNSLVRRSPTGSSLAEASGSIGIVHSLSILYAFHGGYCISNYVFILFYHQRVYSTLSLRVSA